MKMFFYSYYCIELYNTIYQLNKVILDNGKRNVIIFFNSLRQFCRQFGHELTFAKMSIENKTQYNTFSRE